jgi:hypothetical protein
LALRFEKESSASYATLRYRYTASCFKLHMMHVAAVVRNCTMFCIRLDSANQPIWIDTLSCQPRPLKRALVALPEDSSAADPRAPKQPCVKDVLHWLNSLSDDDLEHSSSGAEHPLRSPNQLFSFSLPLEQYCATTSGTHR